MYKRGIRSYLFRVCCAVCAVAIAPIGTGLRASAQTPSTELSFEVATVKPVLSDSSHRFNPDHFGSHVNPTGASYWSMTLGFLIGYAYGVESFQVTGPEWASHDRFDIEARFPEGADKKDDKRMLQALLKERFKLAFHIEKREMESYALVVGKGGEKLRPSPPDPVRPETDVPSTPGNPDVVHGPAKSQTIKNADGSITIDRGAKGTQTVKFDNENWVRHFEDSKMTMHDLAERLGICVDSTYHKIVDETGFQGNYQVAYDCPVPRPPNRAGSGDTGTVPPDPQGTDSLTGSLDALGLKLEKRKVLQNVYVIDHVERPSAN
jgi:uncharacterized protein (TIGR03435 family)